MTDLNLVLLGPPGAGKGTQAARLREDLGLAYIATGDLLRSHRARGTELDRRAATYMSEGQLVPDELVVEMILGEIVAGDGPGCLLDGFPRTIAQADALADALDAGGRAITAVLLIDVPDQLLTARITGRRLCPAGHVYHVEFRPPADVGVCDHDGQPLHQRDDDQLETVRRRLDVYHEATRPLVDYYGDRGLLRRVDGTGSRRVGPEPRWTISLPTPKFLGSRQSGQPARVRDVRSDVSLLTMQRGGAPVWRT